MPDKIIPFRRGSGKTRGPITVKVVREANGQEITGELSLLEREVVKYDLADLTAAALRLDGDVSRGHRSAIVAHLVALKQRLGDIETAAFVSVLGGMVGLETRHTELQPIGFEAAFEDSTDWSDVGLS